jgi:hypothetical protein
MYDIGGAIAVSFLLIVLWWAVVEALKDNDK